MSIINHNMHVKRFSILNRSLSSIKFLLALSYSDVDLPLPSEPFVEMVDEILFGLCGFVIWEEFEYLTDLVYEVILLFVSEPAWVEHSLEVFNLLGHFFFEFLPILFNYLYSLTISWKTL